MKILSWNCRGLGRAPTVRALKALACSEGPEVLFVSETKGKSPWIEKLKSSMGFAFCHSVDCVGQAGGLAFFWKLGVDLEVLYANKYAIVSLVYFDPSDNVWMLITVHGPPYLTKRKKFWESMEEVISTFSGHWLIIGDLNSTTVNSDKVGDNQNGESSSRCFQNFATNVRAIDLGFTSPKFTWTNK